jgi:outer membrane lipoprotein SlyB
MNINTLFKPVLFIALSVALAACNKALPPGEYDTNEVGKVKKVIPGMIISKRAVNLHKKTDELSNPKSTNNFIDSGYNQTHGVEYVVKLNSGSIISVVQNEDLRLKVKQKILVIYGHNTRIVADSGSDAY